MDEEHKIDLERKGQVPMLTRAPGGWIPHRALPRCSEEQYLCHVSVLVSTLPIRSYRTISRKTSRVLRLFYTSLFLPGVFPEAHNLLYGAGCSDYLSG